MRDSLGGAAVDGEDAVPLLYPAVPVRQAARDHLVHRDLLALVVRPPGQGDSDGAAAELPVEDDDHDLVRRGPALLQRLVGFIYQILQFL